VGRDSPITAEDIQLKHQELSSEYQKWEAEIIKFSEAPALVKPVSGIRLAGAASDTLRGFSEAFARTSESSTGQVSPSSSLSLPPDLALYPAHPPP
jgi:hypothetical protein